MRTIFVGLALMAGTLCAETNYYLVEGAMSLPDGRRVGSTVSIVKRVVDREAGKIEETVLSLRGKEAAHEFVTVIRPEGDHAKIASADGGFSGEATFSGPAWAWTGMRFTTKIEKTGGVVEGEDSFSKDEISAVKKVKGADGRMQVEIRESGKAISAAVYDVLRGRLLKE